MDPRWAELGLPLFTELERERGFDGKDGALRFDPKVAKEQQVIERLTEQLAERGWVRFELEKEGTRASFGTLQGRNVIEAYTGYGVLELSLRDKWRSDEVRLAAAQKTTAEKAAELEALRVQLERAAGRLSEARGLEGRRCPEDRLAKLVPKGFFPGQVLYVSPAVKNAGLITAARNTVGAQELPARLEGDDAVDAWWRASVPVRNAGVVIFVEPTSGSQTRVKDSQTFEAGSAAIRFVVSERETGTPLCAGSFFAASSGQVWARADRAAGDRDVAADLSRNATESFRVALAALSKSLAFEKLYP